MAPTPDNIGWWCESCWRELHTAMATAADCRVSAIRRLLAVSLPLRALGDPQSFGAIKVYWREHPDAPPATHPDQRWTHVDKVALAAQWEAVANPRVDGPGPEAVFPTSPCPRCGAVCWRPDWTTTTMWQPRFADGYARPGDGEDVVIGARWSTVCGACGGHPDDRPAQPGDPNYVGRLEADRVCAELLGLSTGWPVYALPGEPRALGLVGFSVEPTGPR